MEIHAQYFGNVTYKEDEIVHFSEGLYGFETEKDFLPIPFYEDSDAMISLQSVNNEDLSFILFNPFGVCPNYDPHISEADMKALEAQSEEDISYYAICTVKEPFTSSTVNLKAPIAVNALNRKARQIILDQPEYIFRHVLEDLQKEGE